MTTQICKYFIYSMSILISYPLFADSEYILDDAIPNPIETWSSDDYTGNVNDIVNPITGTAPQSWNDAVELGLPAYYIDNTNINATNSSNTYGSPDKPRTTIPEITYEAGSYVEIHGGPYDGGGQLFLTADGTPDKPVWVRGADEDNLPIINGETIIKGHYIIMENLKYNTPKKTIQIRSHKDSFVHHAVVRNCVFVGDGKDTGSTSVIGIYGPNSTQRFHDIVIFNNNISKFGNDFDDVNTSDALSSENDYHGVLPKTNVDRVWIINNKIYNLGGDSVQVGTASTSDENRVSNVYIANNDFYTNLENGVDVKEADNTLIINNRIWDWKKHKGNSSTGGAIVIHDKAENTWVVNNTISDSARGITVTSGSLNTWLFGNIIKDIKHPSWDTEWDGGLYDSGAAIHFRGGSSGGAINNTIINYDKGIDAINGSLTIINNILYNRNEIQGKDIWSESSNDGFLITNNLIYPNAFDVSTPKIVCANCIYENPNFIDSNLDMVTIDANSPAIAEASSITNYLDNYKSSFGQSLNKDIYTEPRIVSSLDIGASENQNNGTTNTYQIPMAPTITELQEN